MYTKKLVKQLEKHIAVKFPEYDAKFYSNRRNFYIHMELDKSFFSFENCHKLLNEVGLEKKIISVFLPKLIYPTKWKHNYIFSRKVMN